MKKSYGNDTEFTTEHACGHDGFIPFARCTGCQFLSGGIGGGGIGYRKYRHQALADYPDAPTYPAYSWIIFAGDKRSYGDAC